MEISDRGLNLIKRYEGLRLTAYQDSAGVWTIGYGHTGDVQPDDTITEARAEKLLAEDVGWAEQAVDELIDAPLSQAQFDALVSFTFNVGRGALERSTLRRINEHAPAAKVPEQFTRWVYADCQPLTGLARRRIDEASLYLSEIVEA